MNNIKLRIVQVILESTLPILGYFYWNWSFYFILLFYFLDFLVSSIFIIIKAKKINKYSNYREKTSFLNVLFSFFLVSLFIFLAVLTLQNQYSNFSFYKETMNFILLEDMGLPQGIFLFPLVIYAGYMNYKTQFIMPKKYTFLTVKTLYNHYNLGLLLCVVSFALAFSVTNFVQIPELLSILLLVFGVGLFSFIEKYKY